MNRRGLLKLLGLGGAAAVAAPAVAAVETDEFVDGLVLTNQYLRGVHRYL